MTWIPPSPDWPNLIDRLCARFPHMDGAALSRFRGDRAHLVMYLAETHDLTPREAAQALDEWLMVEPRLPVQLNAA